MKARALLLAALIGALGVIVAPASPAHAVDCVKYFVVDPTLCDDPPPVDEPPPPVEPPPMGMGGMTNAPMTPMPSNPPGEACFRSNARSIATKTDGLGNFIREEYAFTVNIFFCVGTDISGARAITQATLTSTAVPVNPRDRQLCTLTGTQHAVPVTGVGTSSVFGTEEVFSVLCDSPDNAAARQTYRHIIDVFISLSRGDIRTNAEIFPIEGPPPITT
jgi:hypothetical protein